MKKAIITAGTYRNKSLDGVECQLVSPPKFGARGWFANVYVEGQGNFRVQLPAEDSIQIIGPSDDPKTTAEEESEDQIIERIRERFQIFGMSIDGVVEGTIRAMIVSGAAGIGKTETILRMFEAAKVNKNINYEVVRGNIVSSYQLYQLLYEHNDEDTVLILDDCDAILKDASALNILKSALESGDRPRVLTYHSNSVLNMGIPPKFEYSGRMIFITNEDFQRIIEKDRSQLSRHFKALMDRTMYLDLMLHNKREVYCRIKQMVGEGLLDNMDLEDHYHEEILFWLKSNLEGVRSLSLRTTIHIAEMIQTNPDHWQRMSAAFLLKNGF